MHQGHLETLYGFALTVASAKRLLKVLKQMKRHEPVCSRSKRRGLRGRHLRRAWAGLSTRPRRGTDRDSINDWAALTTAWMCLARGGELCIPKCRDVKFSSGRGGPVRDDLAHTAQEEGRQAHGPRADRHRRARWRW